MNRREFLAALAASAASSSLPCFAQAATQPSPSLTIGAATHSKSPDEFVGLSYESAQLANPEFFSAKNHELIQIFRELAPRGNLRLGGGSSEYTTYSDEAPHDPPPFEVFGPDTSKTIKNGTITSSLALHNLREFLDAANWSCLYGLNLGQGTIENAVREATAAHKILGPRLLAFQIGNEPDSFRRRFRPDILWTRRLSCRVESLPYSDSCRRAAGKVRRPRHLQQASVPHSIRAGGSKAS